MEGNLDSYGFSAVSHLGAFAPSENQVKEPRPLREEQPTEKTKGATKNKKAATPGSASSKRGSKESSATLSGYG